MSSVRQWWIVLLALLLAGTGRAEDLVIPGSGNPEYVLDQLAKAFNARQAQHRVVIPPSTGTAGALRDVGEGISSVGRVGRLLKDEERRQGFVHISLGRDPVVIVGGAGVTVRSLSAAQLVDIYSGRITNWRELGGKAAPIRAVGRENSYASRQAIAKVIKPLQDITFGPGVKTVNLDPQLIALLDRYPSSLGMLNRSALSACTTRVVHLALDGVDPTPENLEKGSYLAWVELGLIHKQNGVTPAARAFLDFIRSPDGQRIVRQHGILPPRTAG
ncbi:MAG: substrate-binding domain-containing protein [Candidatus Accumulibacter sp.]|mgnify:CR=1 FL=1|uniref:substrate-binding domain-containing protein n=1 Tax=Accumulibacter sp. TaxID=2053492 RepID=UPI001AC3C353|nr:substrate-binding domain-containing protein [Accumulibacter sp.]MBN8518003.1 substrate-binding domain-containing protein [Accumulibacter sp.]MBO3710418.1 substrate-binding domain-containing protein [Accumulibacter sp.]